MSFSLITKKLACCLDWTMRSICCSYQSKSGERFCTASHALQVILFVPGSEFSRSCQLLQPQTLRTLLVCKPVRRNLKNPEIANTGITNLELIQKVPVERIRVKCQRIASKPSGKEKSVPVLNAGSVAVLTYTAGIKCRKRVKKRNRNLDFQMPREVLFSVG